MKLLRLIIKFIDCLKGKPMTDKDAFDLFERIAKNHEFDHCRIPDKHVEFIGIARYRRFEAFTLNRKNKFLFSAN